MQNIQTEKTTHLLYLRKQLALDSPVPKICCLEVFGQTTAMKATKFEKSLEWDMWNFRTQITIKS